MKIAQVQNERKKAWKGWTGDGKEGFLKLLELMLKVREETKLNRQTGKIATM